MKASIVFHLNHLVKPAHGQPYSVDRKSHQFRIKLFFMSS